MKTYWADNIICINLVEVSFYRHNDSGNLTVGLKGSDTFLFIGADSAENFIEDFTEYVRVYELRNG